MLNVNEIFYSLQGEGKYIGTPSLFIRFNNCNLRCQWKNSDSSVTKCDTPFTSWNPDKGDKYSVEELVNKVEQLREENKFEHIVITGGEPMLQNEIEEFVEALWTKCFNITIETNGTIFKSCFGSFISLSPKLESSIPDNEPERSIHTNSINKYEDTIKRFIDYYTNIVFKFVYNNNIEEIINFIKKYNIDEDQVYLMPQGTTNEQMREKSKECFKLCMKYGFNYTPRLHIDVFGDKRGI